MLSGLPQWIPLVGSLSELPLTSSVDSLSGHSHGLLLWACSVDSLSVFSVDFLGDALRHILWTPSVTCTVDFQGGIPQWISQYTPLVDMLSKLFRGLTQWTRSMTCSVTRLIGLLQWTRLVGSFRRLPQLTCSVSSLH